MTLERFERIVDDPDLLRTITYEELKTLALAYPYAHNLRYLLAIKARQIDHPDVVRAVATAATFSLDRTQLFRLVAPQMIAPQEVWIEEEVLELKPVETLKRKLEEELSSVSREEKQLEPALEAAVDPTPEPAPLVNDSAEKAGSAAHEEEIEAVALPKIPYQNFVSWIGKFNPPVLVSAPGPMTVTVSEQQETVVPKTEVEGQQVPDFQEVEYGEGDEPPLRETPKTSGIAQMLAEKSVAENKDVISETLAKLYAKQGYREKALTMYERLRLAFPEKSAYFAAEIDKLKK